VERRVALMRHALHVPLLLALLLGSSGAELKKCPVGYENQTIDTDMFGYCTRIPTLQESTDRMEAFASSSINALRIIAAHMEKAKHRGDVGACDVEKFEMLRMKALALDMDMLRYTDTSRAGGLAEGAERMWAAYQRISDAVNEANKQGKRYNTLR